MYHSGSRTGGSQPTRGIRNRPFSLKGYSLRKGCLQALCNYYGTEGIQGHINVPGGLWSYLWFALETPITTWKWALISNRSSVLQWEAPGGFTTPRYVQMLLDPCSTAVPSCHATRSQSVVPKSVWDFGNCLSTLSWADKREDYWVGAPPLGGKASVRGIFTLEKRCVGETETKWCMGWIVRCSTPTQNQGTSTKTVGRVRKIQKKIIFARDIINL